jgi:hypothetical protein
MATDARPRPEVLVGPSTFSPALASAWTARGWRVVGGWSPSVKVVIVPTAAPTPDELRAYSCGAIAWSHLRPPLDPSEI